jgi:hypothetical protein
MSGTEIRAILKAAGRTKAERAEYLIREAAKRGESWLMGGPREWSKDEIDNEVIRVAREDQ